MRVAQTLFMMLLAAILVLPTGSANAHDEKKVTPVPPATLRASGTVKGWRLGALHVAVAGGEEWLISVPRKPEQVVFEATATRKWLQRGMPVQFNAKIVLERRKRKIVIKEPVSELTVAPFRADVGVGLFPERNTDQRQDLFARRGREAKKKQARGQPQGVPCLVIGRLVDNRDGKLRVAAGKISVLLELAPEAEIAVQLHDLQWVRPGDKVEITARYPQGRKGQAEGQELSVVAAKVLDGVEKHSKTRRRSARDKKSAEPEKKDAENAAKKADDKDSD